MQIITEKGRLFGFINIVDFGFLLFVLLIITSAYVYTHSPPHVREHQEVIFQMYFLDVPYSVGQELFVPGNAFIATYDASDKATIIAAKPIITQTLLNDWILVENITTLSLNQAAIAFYTAPPYKDYKINYLVTINGSLQTDAEGDLLFNDQNVCLGNTLYLQLNNSYLRGVVWRMNYNYSIALKNITISLNKNTTIIPPLQEEIVYSYGKKAGKIISISENLFYYEIIIEISTDVYNEEYFFDEYPLFPTNNLSFSTPYEDYTGRIVEVS